MKNKCILIIPYFGKFNNYFQLFLNSCAKNRTFNWLIFTDDKRKFSYPNNVTVNYCTFEDFRRLIQKKFKFDISLATPYKLCDYKVAYGYIFEEMIKDFQFWGYCDVDLIFGNLDKFITDDILENYDKIFTLGHLTLYKNEIENNRIFMNCLNGKSFYKKILSSPKSFAFDELLINDLYRNTNKKVYYQDLSANISTNSYKFRVTRKDWSLERFLTEDYVRSIFYWDNGSIKRSFYSEDNGRFVTIEFPYIHLQHRRMSVRVNDYNDLQRFLIIPNSFIELDLKIVESNFGSIPKLTINFKEMYKCFLSGLKWKVKMKLAVTNPKKFTRGSMVDE